MLSLGLLAVGCGDPDRARMIGRWEISAGDRVLDRVDGATKGNASTDADQGLNDAPLDAESVDEAPRMVVEFFRSGALTTETRISNAISTKKGQWSLVKYDAANRIATIRCELIGQSTDHELEFVSDNEVKMVPPNMAGLTKKLLFQRK